MRAAIVGVGFMGWIHYVAYQNCDAADLVGFCSRDADKRAGDWRGIQGNFGPPGEQISVEGMHVAEQMDALLDDASIDLIDVCLPPHLHVPAVERSLAAGKHVLCEKPLALTADEAERLVALAKPGQLMTAHILPFMPEFEFLVDAVCDDRFGKAVTGRFQRTIGPPDWISDFYDRQTVGGPLLDLQVHDTHLIRSMFGMPSSATCVAHRLDGVPKRYETVLHFDQTDGPVVSVAGGVIDSPARPFTHGYEVSFEKATIRFEFAGYADGSNAAIPVTVLHNDGTVERPELDDGDPIAAFTKEIAAVATAVGGSEMHPALDPVIARDALRICEMQMMHENGLDT
ncbi:MAG: Gfo/Idh/MocA family oxidoreductase [Planctomycetota bacterium]